MAQDQGASMSTMTQRTGEDWVRVAPIREAVEDAEARGLTLVEICGRLGWKRHRPGKGRCYAETTKLQRLIGRAKQTSGSFNQTMGYDAAVEICRAIDRDPWELDL